MEPRQTLTLAITKGRILAEALPLLARIGIRPAEAIEASRKLVFDTSLPGLRLLVLRGSDVPT
jgi:ATP phosphoribosyltransferase